MSPQPGLLELLLLAALALSVLGPRDLAVALRRIGRWTGRVRMAAFEFRQQFEALGREVEGEKSDLTSGLDSKLGGDGGKDGPASTEGGAERP